MMLKLIFIRMYGSYEALSGGQASEALQDFSGGIVEVIDMKQSKQDLFAIMEKAETRQSFMSCAITVGLKNILIKIFRKHFKKVDRLNYSK